MVRGLDHYNSGEVVRGLDCDSGEEVMGLDCDSALYQDMGGGLDRRTRATE